MQSKALKMSDFDDVFKEFHKLFDEAKDRKPPSAADDLVLTTTTAFLVATQPQFLIVPRVTFITILRAMARAGRKGIHSIEPDDTIIIGGTTISWRD